MLDLVADATEERGRPFDAVLCVGDVGVIECEDKIDRATRKWAFVGKPELNIPPDPRLVSWPADFVREETPLDAIYRRIDRGGPPVPIYSVDSNHDDHAYLSRLSTEHSGSTYPVDPLGRWRFFRRGQSVEIQKIRVTGCGGIRPPEKKKPVGRHLLEADYQRLGRSGPCDILLTHDAPDGIAGIPGDEMLCKAGLLCRPRWWFFGHFHRQAGPVDLSPGTRAVGLGLFNQEVPRRPGVMGILTIDGQESEWRWHL
jgi:hypothetical protein